jgi:spermidine/putrescine-binding protein
MERLSQRNLVVARRELAAGRLSRREFLSWSAAWGVGTAAVATRASRQAQAQAVGGPINYLTGAGYQDTKLFAEFKAKSGLTVNPLPWNSNEQVFLRVKQEGGANLDIILADAWWPLQNYQAGHLEAISLDRFEGGKTLLPMFRDLPAFKLPDGKLVGFPYHWEYQTVVYRTDKIPTPPDSLRVIFDPKHKGRVVWRNRGTEMIGLMAGLMGLRLERADHPRSWHLEPSELKQVTGELIKAKKAVDPLWYNTNAEGAKMLAADEVDVAFASSYAARAATNQGAKVRAVTKLKTGEQFSGFVDALCLVKNAAHREGALALIDWLTSLRGRQILFERDGYPEVDGAVIQWAIGAGYREQMETRGVLDPTQMVPKLRMLAPPTDLQAWVDAFNAVRAA